MPTSSPPATDAVRPLFSICIPAYNRAKLLPPLLDSIVQQEFSAYEVIDYEDCSSEQAEIAKVCTAYENRLSRLRYHENEQNLGYDGNLRRLIALARGRYCLFMGNDDLLAPGALGHIAKQISPVDNVGVFLRAYAAFDTDSNRPVEYFRYFPEARVFEPGEETIALFFRRCVVISGMVFHRDASHALATTEFDGTLLYQLWLAAMLLRQMRGVYSPQPVALYRNGGVPDFGHSSSERGKHVPGQQTPESSLEFIRGMLRIADSIGSATSPAVTRAIFADLAVYSYPMLSVQARQPRGVFFQYSRDLAGLGFWTSPAFWMYFAGLTLLGPERCHALFVEIKKRLKATPNLRFLSRYRAEPVHHRHDLP